MCVCVALSAAGAWLLTTVVHLRMRDVWFMATTDGGTNEVLAKKLVQVLTRSIPGFFFLPATCLEHSAHLGVLGALKLVDHLLQVHGRKWRYFSAIAMMANTFRGLAPSIFSAWRSLFGDDSAVKDVKALFPRCIAERWGSIDHTEARMLKAGVPRLARTMTHVLEISPHLVIVNDDAAEAQEAEKRPLPKSKSKSKARADVKPTEVVDIVGAEDTKSYQKKMGRWRSQTISTLHDALFDRVLHIMHHVKQPWIHLSNFLKQKLATGSGGHMFHLVCGKADEIYSAFDDMLFRNLTIQIQRFSFTCIVHHSCWPLACVVVSLAGVKCCIAAVLLFMFMFMLHFYVHTPPALRSGSALLHRCVPCSGRDAYWRECAQGLSDCDARFVVLLSRAQILLNASCFDRRVLRPLQSWPRRLLLLGKSPDNFQCPLRRQIATELLQTHAEDLEVNARKVRHRYHSELKEASAQGHLTGRLRVAIRSVAQMWKADSRECERVNKMLKLFTERGPTSSAELISSRACIKHFLGEAVSAGATKARRKWSHYRPTARKLLDICLQSWGDRDVVTEDSARWQQPAPASDLPSERDTAVIFAQLHPQTLPTVAQNWAACYNMILNKHLGAEMSSTDPTPVIAIGVREKGQSRSKFKYFAVVEKVRTLHRLTPCVMSSEGSLSLQKPLAFETSNAVLSGYWEDIRKGNTVQVLSVGTRKCTDFMEAENAQLALLGSAQPGKSVAVLRKPSKKTLAKIDPSKAAQSPKPGTKPSRPSSSASAAAPAVDEDDYSDADADIQEGLDLLLEAAEEELGAEDVGQEEADCDADRDVMLAKAAFSNVLQEAMGLQQDELGETAAAYAEQQKNMSMENVINQQEYRRAVEAVESGMASKFEPSTLKAMGIAEDDMQVADVVDAVLNQQGSITVGLAFCVWQRLAF